MPTIDQEMNAYFQDRKGTVDEDYLPEDETLQEYVFQSRPLRVLDNIASRTDVAKFPIIAGSQLNSPVTESKENMQSIILCLSAVRQIISNGLSILGISPMQKM